jgi:hypothetical protein
MHRPCAKGPQAPETQPRTVRRAGLGWSGHTRALINPARHGRHEAECIRLSISAVTEPLIGGLVWPRGRWHGSPPLNAPLDLSPVINTDQQPVFRQEAPPPSPLPLLLRWGWWWWWWWSPACLRFWRPVTTLPSAASVGRWHHQVRVDDERPRRAVTRRKREPERATP